MNRCDVKVGDTVYHTLSTHWGPGIVEAIERAIPFETWFERGKFRVIVQFENHTGSSRLRFTELRKTPNRKKIREMVAMYRKQGVDAQDGGDRLILPKQETPA